MPEVKNEEGEVVATMPYTQTGELAAEKMVEENPGYTINDASQRSAQTYAGGGKTGYNVPMYEDGGKVTKRDVKKLTKVKVSLKDARDEDIQKRYGTEGKPWKTRRAIKKEAKKKRKRLMELSKENRIKKGKKNPDKIYHYTPEDKQYGSRVKKSKISGKK